MLDLMNGLDECVRARCTAKHKTKYSQNYWRSDGMSWIAFLMLLVLCYCSYLVVVVVFSVHQVFFLFLFPSTQEQRRLRATHISINLSLYQIEANKRRESLMYIPRTLIKSITIKIYDQCMHSTKNTK